MRQKITSKFGRKLGGGRLESIEGILNYYEETYCSFRFRHLDRAYFKLSFKLPYFKTHFLHLLGISWASTLTQKSVPLNESVVTPGV
jgi:hypothetical protein